MSGAAGHIKHLFENRSLQLNDIINIFEGLTTGKIKATEKVDGYNILIGQQDGNVRVARNRTDLKNGGLSYDEVSQREFKGGEEVRQPYLKAIKSFQTSLSALNSRERRSLFGANGSIFLNCELHGPLMPNVINYDKNHISIHNRGHRLVENGEIKEVELVYEEEVLESLLNKLQQESSRLKFKIIKTPSIEFQKMEDGWLTKLKERFEREGFTDGITIESYIESKLLKDVLNSLPPMPLSKTQMIVDRILSKKGSLIVPSITKGMSQSYKQEVKKYVKNSKNTINNILFEIKDIIHEASVQVLSGCQSAFVSNGEFESNRLREETREAAEKIRSYRGTAWRKAHEILDKNLRIIKDIDNINSTVEGVVFEYNNHLYKLTGNFAPMNQILGLFKYGRGEVPSIGQKSILEAKEGDTYVILPGKFKPPHRGHLDMIKHYRKFGDVIVLISPKTVDGITAEMSRDILDEYVRDADLGGVHVEISSYASPVQAAIEYGNQENLAGSNIILGASNKGGDAAERFSKNLQKYVENATVLDPMKYAFEPTAKLNATEFREALKNKEDITEWLPKKSRNNQEIIQILKSISLKEVNTHNFMGIFRRLAEEMLQEAIKFKVVKTKDLEEMSAAGAGAVVGAPIKKEETT